MELVDRRKLVSALWTGGDMERLGSSRMNSSEEGVVGGELDNF